jgi:hypothetical protein
MKMSSWKESTRERVKEAKQGSTFKLAEGMNCFRILPNKKGTKMAPYIEFNVHRNVGPDETFVRCGKELDGTGKCWMCDVKLPELRKSNVSQKRAAAERMAPARQAIAQVSVVDQENGKFGPPKTWWLSVGGAKSMGIAILNMLASEKRSYDDPVKGYNILIERTGTSFKDTRYGAPDHEDSPSAVPKNVMSAMKDLDELVLSYSRQEQEAKFYGKREEDVEVEDEEPEDDEEEATEDEAEEEEAEEETEEEEEEDDTPPVKKKASKKTSKKTSKKEEPEDEPEEDEEEEEPEEEEEEEEPEEDEESEEEDEPEDEPED